LLAALDLARYLSERLWLLAKVKYPAKVDSAILWSFFWPPFFWSPLLTAVVVGHKVASAPIQGTLCNLQIWR
jgi:hypothetical protein